MAAQGPPPAHGTQPQMIDQHDIDDWMKRFNDGLKDSSTLTAPASHDARPWHAGFFECIAPIDTCQ